MPLRMLIDTSSQMTWIRIQELLSKSNSTSICQGSCSGNLALTVKIEYQNGVVFGNLVSDTFQIGDYNISYFNFLIANQIEGEINESYSGIIGLSPGNSIFCSNIARELKSRNLIKRAIFSIDLHSAAGPNSTIQIGDWNRSIANTTADMNWFTLNVQDSWTVDVLWARAIGDQEPHEHRFGGNLFRLSKAILDTASMYISLPIKVIDRFLKVQNTFA